MDCNKFSRRSFLLNLNCELWIFHNDLSFTYKPIFNLIYSIFARERCKLRRLFRQKQNYCNWVLITNFKYGDRRIDQGEECCFQTECGYKS